MQHGGEFIRDCSCVLWQLTVVIDGIGDDGCQSNTVASSLIWQKDLETQTHHVQVVFLRL